MKKPIYLKIGVWGVLFAIPVVLIGLYDTKSEAGVHLAYVGSKNLSIESETAQKDFLLKDSYQSMIDTLQANLIKDLDQPNILKEDILRGWYLAGEEEKKYGTPESWIFLEEAENSKWMSPNVIEEVKAIDEKLLCQQTAGQFTSSCLKSTDLDCKFQQNNSCECGPQTKWYDGQGCILTSEEGGYISINSSELAQGFYLGLPNQKKLNTPQEWQWFESGENSTWRKH